MNVFPSSDIKRVEFVEQHIAPWTLNAVAVGLNAAQVLALDNASKAARTAFNEQKTAQNAAKAKTVTFHNTTDAMSDLARVAITNIKNKAESTNDENVFVLAQIDPPADPTPAGVPAKPTDVVADPNADGTISVSWKGSNANQTWFSVWRRVGEGAWSNVGSTATRKFVDGTVPAPTAGSNSLSYVVRAQRQNFISEASTEATVNFGAGGAGFFANDVAGQVGMQGDAAEAA